MKFYEVLIESINPCGGEAHATKQFKEIEADDPVAWVRENGRFPVMDTAALPNGDIVVVSGNGRGYLDRYTFTE